MFIQGRQEFIKNELKIVCIKCDFSNSNWMVNDGANQAFLTHMISCGLTPTKLKNFFLYNNVYVNFDTKLYLKLLDSTSLFFIESAKKSAEFWKEEGKKGIVDCKENKTWKI